MRRLLEGDMRRVVSKILPWILLVAAYIYMVVSISTKIDTSLNRDFFFLEKVELSYQTVLMIIGFAALIGIYADEFKSMSMITVIGRGISREKFVLAKFLDVCILTLQMELLTIVYVMILKVSFGVSFTALETKYLMLTFLMGYIETLSYVVIAAIFYFLSESAAVGMFAYLTFTMIIPVTLALVMSMTKFAKYHPEQYYVSGMTASAVSGFIMGDFAMGIAYLFLTLVIYVFAAVAITIVIFRKKELNF